MAVSSEPSCDVACPAPFAARSRSRSLATRQTTRSMGELGVRDRAGAGAAPAGTSGSALALYAVGRAFGERVVLRDVSMSVPAGRTLAVLGPNGAGKTTL